MEIGIIADDLTGAADAVAPFARHGLRTGVAWAITSEFMAGPNAVDVLGVCADTRDVRDRKATLLASTVRRYVRHLKVAEPRIYVKKIDSTLRGLLRLELDAVRRELPGRLALICPAFPANGRTVREGRLYIDGVSWTQTEFAPSVPAVAENGTVRAAFEALHDTTAAELDLPTLREGMARLESTLERMAAAGVDTVFCDAVTLEDLEILARLVLRRPEYYLPVGSGGLTAALAACQVKGTPADTWPSWAEAAFCAGRVLVVVGSRHTASRRQAALVIQKASIRPVICRNYFDPVSQLMQQILEDGPRILMLITPDEPDASVSIEGVGYSLRLELKRLMKSLPRKPLDALILTGGDTAYQFLKGHIAGIQIVGETQPGVVLGRLCASNPDPTMFHNLPIITKAGGFGVEDTLARCVGLV